MAMGYDRPMASAAMRIAHFRPELAIEILLGERGLMSVYDLIAKDEQKKKDKIQEKAKQEVQQKTIGASLDILSVDNFHQKVTDQFE